MKNKFFVLGISAMVLVFGLALNGCGTFSSLANMRTPRVETETSKTLLDGANDLLIAAQPDGLAYNVFKTAMERKFPGMKFTSQYDLTGVPDPLVFDYDGRKYQMYTSNILSADKVRRYEIAKWCYDITPAEKTPE
ncbi:MAG: hypothetical protein LBQ38_03445 [Spirochaetaceae bacterium]|jgi:hypothetical protein|nr:hypothetical protein [Spirochaetaceae bacterium]